MSQGFYGFPTILGLLRATAFKATGKIGAANGAALAGGTASGAPTSGQFDVGDAVIGADGTLFLCTVAGSPGTWVQLGTLVDPLTTRGDLLVRGASATTRLALGSSNQVLTSNGTDVAWAASPASAGGALTQMASTVLGASAATITFSGISGGYSSLEVVLQARGDTSATVVNLSVQFNGDTAGNYDDENMRAEGTGVAAGQDIAATAITAIPLSAATAPSGAAGVQTLLIPNYAGTTFRKGLLAHGGYYEADSSGNIAVAVRSGQWRSTSAITSVKLFPASGNFVAGTSCQVYGLS